MALHDKLAHDSGSAASLDGVERILLSELAEVAVSPSRIALVDAPSALLADELAGLFPNASLVGYHDSFVAAAEFDDFAAQASWGARFVRVHSELGDRFPGALFADVDVVVGRLPKSLDYVDEFAASASNHLRNSALVLLAERTKYMTPSQNEVLGKSFSDVSASLGRFKSRVLRARAPRGVKTNGFPKRARVAELDLEIVAHGGVFAGTKLDIGTRLLVENLESLLAGVPDARDFVDAGCGTGVLSARIAQLRDSAQVTGVDVSAGAVLSTVETAQANGFADRITAIQDDALAGVAPESADVVVCNPPFHTGTALDTDVAQRMFRNAGRVLRPGGQLWTVYNSPLPYKGALTRGVGPTRVAASNRKFTVTVSTKR